MRIGARQIVIFVLSAIGIIGLYGDRANAWPVHTRVDTPSQHASVELVGDTCWWWGTRWQYGWRGYGWYWCWEQPRPAAPVAIAPESVPESAIVEPEPCVRTWRDKSGKLRSRRTC